MFDPQTSGGLLLAAASEDASALEAELQAYEISARTGRDARKDLEDQLIYGWYQSRKTISLKKDS